MESGGSETAGAGNIHLTTGKGSSRHVGGNINIIASVKASAHVPQTWYYQEVEREVPKEISLGFDVVSPSSDTYRQVGLQLRKTSNSTRVVSTVPMQVTTVQYSSDSRIKKDITDVDTGDLLDRINRIELKEYGYTDEWRRHRDLDRQDIRVRGVIAQELREGEQLGLGISFCRHRTVF